MLFRTKRRDLKQDQYICYNTYEIKSNLISSLFKWLALHLLLVLLSIPTMIFCSLIISMFAYQLLQKQLFFHVFHVYTFLSVFLSFVYFFDSYGIISVLSDAIDPKKVNSFYTIVPVLLSILFKDAIIHYCKTRMYIGRVYIRVFMHSRFCSASVLNFIKQSIVHYWIWGLTLFADYKCFGNGFSSNSSVLDSDVDRNSCEATQPQTQARQQSGGHKLRLKMKRQTKTKSRRPPQQNNSKNRMHLSVNNANDNNLNHKANMNMNMNMNVNRDVADDDDGHYNYDSEIESISEVEIEMKADQNMDGRRHGRRSVDHSHSGSENENENESAIKTRDSIIVIESSDNNIADKKSIHSNRSSNCEDNVNEEFDDGNDNNDNNTDDINPMPFYEITNMHRIRYYFSDTISIYKVFDFYSTDNPSQFCLLLIAICLTILYIITPAMYFFFDYKLYKIHTFHSDTQLLCTFIVFLVGVAYNVAIISLVFLFIENIFYRLQEYYIYMFNLTEILRIKPFVYNQRMRQNFQFHNKINRKYYRPKHSNRFKNITVNEEHNSNNNPLNPLYKTPSGQRTLLLESAVESAVDSVRTSDLHTRLEYNLMVEKEPNIFLTKLKSYLLAKSAPKSSANDMRTMEKEHSSSHININDDSHSNIKGKSKALLYSGNANIIARRAMNMNNNKKKRKNAHMSRNTNNIGDKNQQKSTAIMPSSNILLNNGENWNIWFENFCRINRLSNIYFQNRTDVIFSIIVCAMLAFVSMVYHYFVEDELVSSLTLASFCAFLFFVIILVRLVLWSWRLSTLQRLQILLIRNQQTFIRHQNLILNEQKHEYRYALFLKEQKQKKHSKMKNEHSFKNAGESSAAPVTTTTKSKENGLNVDPDRIRRNDGNENGKKKNDNDCMAFESGLTLELQLNEIALKIEKNRFVCGYLNDVINTINLLSISPKIAGLSLDKAFARLALSWAIGSITLIGTYYTKQHWLISDNK